MPPLLADLWRALGTGAWAPANTSQEQAITEVVVDSRQATPFGPPAVAVHDEGDVLRQFLVSHALSGLQGGSKRMTCSRSAPTEMIRIGQPVSLLIHDT